MDSKTHHWSLYCLKDIEPHSLLRSWTHSCAGYETDIYLCFNKKNTENHHKRFITNKRLFNYSPDSQLIYSSSTDWEPRAISPGDSSSWVEDTQWIILFQFLFQSCDFNFTFTFNIENLLPWRCTRLSPGQQIKRMPEWLRQQSICTRRLPPSSFPTTAYPQGPTHLEQGRGVTVGWLPTLLLIESGLLQNWTSHTYSQTSKIKIQNPSSNKNHQLTLPRLKSLLLKTSGLPEDFDN